VGEQFAVATTPGLTLTKSSVDQDTSIQVMASGITEGVQGFEPLPYVATELKKIGEIYPAQVFKNELFTLER